MADVFTIKNQNNIEGITQNFGKFFHSPLYYNTQHPYFGTVALKADATGTMSLWEENADYSNGTTLSTESDANSRYFSIKPEISDILTIYSPYISPAYFLDDGTQYRLVPCIGDSSILIRVYSSTGSTFDTWNPSSGVHPFSSDYIFYITFYGKRI
jgi:hypothetical protein